MLTQLTHKLGYVRVSQERTNNDHVYFHMKARNLPEIKFESDEIRNVSSHIAYTYSIKISIKRLTKV